MLPEPERRRQAGSIVSAALILPDLGKYKNATSDKARRMLGWSPRGNEDALVATADSLLRLGLLKR